MFLLAGGGGGLAPYMELLLVSLLFIVIYAIHQASARSED
jgi:hypothetical protein